MTNRLYDRVKEFFGSTERRIPYSLDRIPEEDRLPSNPKTNLRKHLTLKLIHPPYVI